MKENIMSETKSCNISEDYGPWLLKHMWLHEYI